MVGFPSRCVDVTLTVSLPQLKCSNDILGDFGNIADFGRGLGSIPSQLGKVADCVVEDVREQIEAAVKAFTDVIEPIFDLINVTIPTPLWSNLEMPTIEFELRLRALWQEFKLYLQQQLIDLISKIPGLSFILDLINIPIPFLEGVSVLDAFTEEGRASIRAAVVDKIDQVADAIGAPWDITFDGDLGLTLPELRVENILSRIYGEIEKLLTQAMWSALSVIYTLTQPIRRIWQQLGFPALPALVFLNFEDFFNGIWEGIKDLAISVQEKMQMAIDAILDFDLGEFLNDAFGSILDAIPWPFPTKVRELLALVDRDWDLTAPEMTFSVVTQAVQTLFNRLPLLILELWLQLIKPFLQAIQNILAGVSALLQYIPFTFCSFVSLIAAPLLSMSSTIADLLPPGFELVSA